MIKTFLFIISFLTVGGCDFNTANLVIQDPSSPQTVYLKDDFNDNSRGTIWILGNSAPSTNFQYFSADAEQPNQISETGNHLVFGEPLTDSKSNVYETKDFYNMTDKWFSIEVIQAPTQSGTRYREAGLWLMNVAGDGWEIFISDNKVYAGTYLHDGTYTIGDYPFDATNHKFLRIRFDSQSDTVEFEVSADSVLWSTLRSNSRDNIPITQSKLLLYSYAQNGADGPTGSPAAIFDNFNTNIISY